MTKEQFDKYINNIIEKSTLNITKEHLEKGIFNFGNTFRIEKLIEKIINKEEITICSFGGSITRGASHHLAPKEEYGLSCNFEPKRYHDVVCDFLEEIFGCKITRVNAGIGATDSVLATHRIDEDVLKYNPDLVINEWCCNDSKEIPFKQGTYESVVRKLIDNGCAFILYSFGEKDGTSSQILHEPISRHYDAPHLSYRDAFISLNEYQYLSNDRVHPNTTGHTLAGLLIIYYIGKVILENTHSEKDFEKNITPFCEDSTSYDGARVIRFKDIYDEKIEGMKITSMGSFEIDKEVSTFAYREYYGFSADYKEKYEPLVIEVDSMKTLFFQIFRSNQSKDTSFYAEINGEKVEKPTFTCQHGNDNRQIEFSYHWATERAVKFDKVQKATIKIYPTNKNKEKCVKLFALLIS
ncbi:MAG: SGNH/GDSL hydrolase family protein [Ruminococcaceae bacterium]|nr:SGNH/GDSL hydrolase family protein [Oscillospiraceae bacterium]